MANPAIIYKLPKHVAKLYYHLRSATSKLQRTASSIAFVNKAVTNNVVPTFAKITATNINDNDRRRSEQNNLKRQETEHRRNLQTIIEKHNEICLNLTGTYGEKMYRLVQHLVLSSLRDENIKQLQTKNNKLYKLTGKHTNTQYIKSKIPIINLSSEELDTAPLEKTGLNHSFIDKNKFTKRDISVEMESLASIMDDDIQDEEKDEFHEFLRASTNKFAKNIHHQLFLKLLEHSCFCLFCFFLILIKQKFFCV